MIPDDYLRYDIYEVIKHLPNIEEYNCPHQWWCDCGTVSECEPLIYFCHWCWKQRLDYEKKDIKLMSEP